MIGAEELAGLGIERNLAGRMKMEIAGEERSRKRIIAAIVPWSNKSRLHITVNIEISEILAENDEDGQQL